jgi:small conductance mechanosensitive channel
MKPRPVFGPEVGVDALWQNLEQFLRDYGPRLLGAVLVLAAGWLLVRFLIGPLRRLLTRTQLDASVASFLVNSARTVLLFAILLAVLNQLGVETASLLTVLGAMALAVALSLQGTLANFASGLIVLSFRIVRVGDLIEAGDVRGRVSELLPFHAVIVTADNQRVTVPNTTLTGAAVRNHSALPNRRAEWTLPLTARDDLAAVKESLLARLKEDGRILAEPQPQLYVKEWTDDRRVLAVTAWTATADSPAVQQELLEVLGMALEELRQRRAAEKQSGDAGKG